MKNRCITLILLVFALLGCKEKKTYSLIQPVPAGYSTKNLTDATVPARFSSADFNWMGGNLTMQVFSEDLYDAVALSQMKLGDTLIFDGDRIVVSKIEKKGEQMIFNGGIENGGADLIVVGGGMYRGFHFNDHSTYTGLGKITLPLAEDFVIVDCGETLQEPSDTISSGQKVYLETLEEVRRDFNELNTKVLIEKGMITRITRRWIP